MTSGQHPSLVFTRCSDARAAANAASVGGEAALIHVVETAPVVGKSIEYEHFGFRDGISQPIIRGTQRFPGTDATPRDIVEPGEFILGYENGQGYFSPPVIVRAESDGGNVLPIALAENLAAFPDFWADDPAYAPRDLGRNGSFMVIRWRRTPTGSTPLRPPRRGRSAGTTRG